jgi:hypothetical protein
MDKMNQGETYPAQGALAPTVSANAGPAAAASIAAHFEPADTRPAFNVNAVPLWIAIRNRRIDFTSYARFVNLALCEGAAGGVAGPPDLDGWKKVMSGLRDDSTQYPRPDCLKLGWVGHGMNAYELLKTATEIFLLLECGAFISTYLDKAPDGEVTRVVPGAEPTRVSGTFDINALQGSLSAYLGGGTRLPYIQRVLEATFASEEAMAMVSKCDGLLEGRVECPCFLELIWSYWQEEGMLVQSLNALSMRFQNRRISDGRDPLAQLELSPLRPLSSIFWGYVQDEQHRLSLARRNHEYEHEYGISLRGKAVPSLARIADRRSKFIEAFHDLLFRCAQYFQQAASTTYIPDPFPLLNGLKEVHLILSQGAGNQFGELPWTARVEMLMQQWILARPEIREFLGRRPMVAYPEAWMPNADALKTVMGWTDTSITHFRDLAAFGEQLVLSIRWHAWSAENDANVARDWANYFRPEIQAYMYAYRIATGHDLTLEPKDSAAAADRKESPSLLLERKLADQRRSNGTL